MISKLEIVSLTYNMPGNSQINRKKAKAEIFREGVRVVKAFNNYYTMWKNYRIYEIPLNFIF